MRRYARSSYLSVVVKFVIGSLAVQLGLESLISLLDEDAGANGDEEKDTGNDGDYHHGVSRLINGWEGLVGFSLIDNPVLTIEAKSIVLEGKHCVVSTEEGITEKIPLLTR
jgi:hypothetical protein